MIYMENNIFAGIVTYNPDIEVLDQNIRAVCHQVDKIIIFDNGSRNRNQIINLINSIDAEKIIFLFAKKNLGIAYALNRLCEWGIVQKYSWIFTLDQDTIVPHNIIDKLSAYIDMDNIAIISPNVIYKNNERFSFTSTKRFEYVPWVITSASLMNLSVWYKLNGFDEWLFIDGVDYDFGIRANKNGYHIVRTYDTSILQRLGQLQCRKILGKTIYVTNHPGSREYYMIRNSIYLWKKLGRGHPAVRICKNIAKICLFENQKKSKLNNIIHGIIAGIKSLN